VTGLATTDTHALLLTGHPGVGKTRVICRVKVLAWLHERVEA
jgi:nucleoside-triphosphatase THEP1